MRGIAIGCYLSFLFLTATAHGQNEPVKPLPADVRAAWKKAGARVGWIVWTSVKYRCFSHELGDERWGALPAFQIHQMDTLAGLPIPTEPFGLSIYFFEETKSDLKGLERFAELRSL